MRNKLKVLLGFAICMLMTGCTNKEPVTVSDFALNTYVSITLYGTDNEDIARDAVSLIKSYENIFSKTISTSDVYTLNKNGCISNADPNLYELIKKGLAYCDLTDGSLDITIGALTGLWDITGASPHVPDKDELTLALSTVNYENIILENDNTIIVNNNAQVDTGAVAKGYIADRLRDYLKESGIENGIINLGGNILCLGSKPDGSSYVVGIQKPFGASDETILTLDINNKSVVTSGTYERYFEEDGILYHHILDPDTGYPSDSGLCSATIISDDSFTGDCLSTACLVMGCEKALALINSLDDVYAILIDDEMNIYYSDGAENFLH